MPAYRLQTVLEMRERAEEAAKQAFSEAVRELTKQQKELERLKQELEQKRAEREFKIQEHLKSAMSGGGMAINAMNSFHRFERRLKDEEVECEIRIERQAGVVEEARVAMEQKRHEMAEAAKEKKAIDKHKENWVKQVRKERDAREELVQEEIGNTLHLARQRKLQ